MDAKANMKLAAFTSLLIQSKNQEVESLSVTDIRDYCIADLKLTKNQIIEAEYKLRNSIGHENECSTLFDFVMYYIRLLKLECQNQIQEPVLDSLYEWISVIEGLAYDFSKSLLIDVHSLQFNLSITVASLITVSILIHQKVMFS